jgi:sigma-54 dependent transcriptional regulator, acetoin dehydrogenase operon transcriptional activator AcoR
MRTNDSEFERRLMLARNLFEDGREVPQQLVSDAVFRSWERSRGNGLLASDRALFNAVSVGDRRRVQERNRVLLDHAEPEMQRLFGVLENANWVVACVDERGFVVRSLGESNPACRDLGNVFRPGVNVGERTAGTTGPGCALADGRLVAICGSEHFLEEARPFACAAAPIFDPKGQLIGALDASRLHDGRPIGVLEAIALAARSIENRMVTALGGTFCLSLHYSAEFSGSSLRGLLSFSEDGVLLGANPAARQLLDLERAPQWMFEHLFGESFSHVVDRLRRAKGEPMLIEAANGLRLQARVDPAKSSAETGRSVLMPAGAQQPPVMHVDPTVAPLLSMARRAFFHDVPILINGETGTGKEMLAQSLHAEGPRRNGPFVAVNCSSIPASLIESELFGYEPGAFTGARRGGMAGKFEQANRGTLFLDEIGDMPLEMQARLLRVLQEQQLTRLGGSQNIQLQFSLICATHRDLAERVSQGSFREDLYYRINGLRVELPPLRQRADIDALIDTLLVLESGARRAPSLSARARQALREHAWPGNVRELRHALRLGVALCEQDVIEIEHLPATISSTFAVAASSANGSLEQAECEAVRLALARHAGNVSATARTLGIARATLYRKLKQFGLYEAASGREEA